MKESTLPQANEKALAKKKLLIVEDEGDMCLLLEILLTGKNLNLDHVKTIKAAEKFMQEERPDIVILDNKLPDGYGMEFLVYLKSDFPETKVIMISGFDNSAKDAALESGADIFLEKPFTRDQLYDAIKKLVGEPAAVAEN